MDAKLNPYAPGAGTPPPELAGRDEWIEKSLVAFDRLKNIKAAKGFVYYGLRGVGKTVLINHIRRLATEAGYLCVAFEAPESRSLPGVLAPALRSMLIQQRKGMLKLVDQALAALSGFVNAMRVKYEDVEVRMEFEPAPGIADSGDLESDLIQLFDVVGKFARQKQTVVSLFIDELQYVAKEQLNALIMALHRANQDQHPITMIAAGLPQVLSQLGNAKTYAERLFEFARINGLSDADARRALVLPARALNVEFTDEALVELFAHTNRYPYFLQVWGMHSWNVADASPIELADVKKATGLALTELDNGFFRVRFDRCTAKEKEYLRTMAELGPGPYRSGDITARLGVKAQSVSVRRDSLISKGMIYSPSYGEIAFTVPLFDEFMKRVMPNP